MISKITKKLYHIFLETDDEKFVRKQKEYEIQARIVHNKTYKHVMTDLKLHVRDMKHMHDLINDVNRRFYYRGFALQQFRVC